ncbi:class I SAM-dependent methyltransferase [Thalassospira profundimaris]|uniref:class I SAM-dependent methyltransferase n=1 Tax=Thalassospira profundimaris TaxID=502049 RepID=UPI0002872233|nr:class I SAM-dependent methyltransferase [Thalassospira profundimaris]EKF09229.1 type 11 methyltransferase [Thalassospira profundimaris WP0211]
MLTKSAVRRIFRTIISVPLLFFNILRLTLKGEGIVLKSHSGNGVFFAEGSPSFALQTTIREMSERQCLTPEGADGLVGTLNAVTRDDWIAKTLAALPEGAKILDAGAGEMQYKQLCSHLEYVSQDLAEYDGSGNSAGLQTGDWNTDGIDIVSDICDMPLEDGGFDAVLCTEVLEHVSHPVMALKEMGRVLRPGGKIIITAPFCSLTHFAPYHYATGFNKYFYLHHLTELGFRDIKVEENGNFFEFVAQELRRIPSMAEQYAGMKLSPEGSFAISTLLSLLQEYSDHDKGSNEMLHFDCQVTAVKVE